MCLTAVGDLVVLSLPRLNVLHQDRLIENEKVWRLRQAGLGTDGRIVLLAGEAEFQRYSIFADENMFALLLSIPCLTFFVLAAWVSPTRARASLTDRSSCPPSPDPA